MVYAGIEAIKKAPVLSESMLDRLDQAAVKYLKQKSFSRLFSVDVILDTDSFRRLEFPKFGDWKLHDLPS